MNLQIRHTHQVVTYVSPDTDPAYVFVRAVNGALQHLRRSILIRPTKKNPR